MLTLKDILYHSGLYEWCSGTTLEGAINAHQSPAMTEALMINEGLLSTPVLSVTQTSRDGFHTVSEIKVVTAPIRDNVHKGVLIITFYDEEVAQEMRRAANLRINAQRGTTNEERLREARRKRATAIDCCPFCQSEKIGIDDPDDPSSDSVVDFGCEECGSFVREDGFWQKPYKQGDGKITVWHPIKDQIQILLPPNAQPQE